MSGAGRAKLVLRAQEALLGRPTFACLEALNASQWLPRDAVLEIQRQALNRLLASALAHCPWHGARLRAAGLARDIVTGRVGREDLRALPPMTRHDARQHGALMRWSAVPGGAQAYSTGGSSGEPLIFHFGRARQAADAAGPECAARRFHPGDPSAVAPKAGDFAVLDDVDAEPVGAPCIAPHDRVMSRRTASPLQ